ncbi:AmmeMemoRadiSam system protein B [Candidatus Peregrinibacteria bacterium]|nr:AmmeMemoRadiSam system protein B [Candidatus Peregrinibacteria bacterium]
MIRPAAVAGTFYPESPEKLGAMVRQALDAAPDFHLPAPKALICPHAGYVYSGKIAGVGYRQLLEGAPPKAGRLSYGQTPIFFCVGPAHYEHTEISVGSYDACETPLGKIKVNKALCEELEEQGIPFDEKAHQLEHSLEVQWPFIQTFAPQASIVPLLYGNVPPNQLADLLDPYFERPDITFIFSSDLSHYLPYEEAVAVDKKSLAIIESLNVAKEREIDACGKTGIQALMRLAKRHGYQCKKLGYYNSGDVIPGREGVVGYGALAIFSPQSSG